MIAPSPMVTPDRITASYAYAYGTDADFAEEMKETWYDSFECTELIFPDEE